MSSQLCVTVVDSEMRDKTKKFTIYAVTIRSADKTTVTFRRYNEFLSLNEKLKKLFPAQAQSFKLPGKKIFRNFDPELIKVRRNALKEYVTRIVSNPVVSANSEIRSFFNLDTSRQSSTEEEDEDEAYSSGSGPLTFERHSSASSVDSNTFNLGPVDSLHSKPSDFEFLKVIGKGSFGKVLLARHKTERILYAVKVVSKSHILKKNEVRHVMCERNVLLKNIHHPFLVGLHYSFQTSARLYLVLDYINGGELFFHLQRERVFSEDKGRFYAAEIASALGYLHSHNIMYRDLKPENILIDSQGHVALTDFGLCKENVENRPATATFCGTPEYLAPEVIEKKPYDKGVDWWCLGAVLYEILFGLPPFYSRNVSEMYDNICTKPLVFKNQGQMVSVEARSILEGLLEKKREKRLGSRNDFEEIRNHPFFASINWKLLDQRLIRPPYIPNVVNDMDLQNFDQEFVREAVPTSYGHSADRISVSPTVLRAGKAFDGFSYIPPLREEFQF
jgi:serum/glucocorticoid-regulated kinase 3